MKIGSDLVKLKRKPAPIRDGILGPNQIEWCKKWIKSFPEIYEKSEAAEKHARELKAKIGEPTQKGRAA